MRSVTPDPENAREETRRRPGAKLDPKADRLILEATKRLLHDVGYARLTIDAVAREAGVARTTVYRRYRDKAELVSGAIDTLRRPAAAPDSGDARRDLIGQLENARRNFDMSLAGTLLMEERHNPELLDLFRRRMITPRRAVLREVIERGIERGQLREGLDVERVTDLLFGSLFFAVLSDGKPGPGWSEQTVAALWPSLVRGRTNRASRASAASDPGARSGRR
jgi:AcrR family transcriptional regulator